MLPRGVVACHKTAATHSIVRGEFNNKVGNYPPIWLNNVKRSVFLL